MVELVVKLALVIIRPFCSGRHKLGSITGTHVSILFLAARRTGPLEELYRPNRDVRRKHADGGRRMNVLALCEQRRRRDMWLSHWKCFILRHDGIMRGALLFAVRAQGYLVYFRPLVRFQAERYLKE